MSTLRKSTSTTPTRITRLRPAGSLAYDWAMVAVSTWFVVGLFVDGWAHNHNIGVETFFTPWHALLYSGFAATAALTVGAVVRNHRRGYAWRSAVAPGYDLSILGAIVFALAGVGDMFWHLTFGIEANIEALLSPTHLALAFGFGLLITGPVRSAWQRNEGRQGANWRQLGPALVATAFLLSGLTFMTQFINPFVFPLAGKNYGSPSLGVHHLLDHQSEGIAGILLLSALLTGLVLILGQRWRLPFGAFTLILGVDAALLSLMRDQFWVIPTAVVAGLIVDALLLRLRPAPDGALPLRLLAIGTPVALWAVYFLALQLTQGIWWSVHLWVGCIVITGIEGWLLSYVARGPATQGM